jgi:hypothetical protein
MKQITFILFLFVCAKFSFSQEEIYPITFDNSTWHEFLRIDSASNPNNIWEVGVPMKSILNNAFSTPNVIITKTTGYYPINDTSYFIVKRIAGAGFAHHHTVTILGRYFVNSDTLTDYGKIEISYNNGNTWLDLSDTTISPYACPKISGNSNGWKSFGVSILTYDTIINNVQPLDTLLYRFSFISDSIQTNKDGLMYDNLVFEDYVESINEIQNNNLISIYPNPTKDLLIIYMTTNYNKQKIQILNYLGQVVYENQNFTGETIDTRQLDNGIFYLKYSDTKSYAIKTFVVIH